MVALCKAPTKSAGIGLPITAVCKNAGKKTLGQDDFFVVFVTLKKKRGRRQGLDEQISEDTQNHDATPSHEHNYNQSRYALCENETQD